MMFDSIILNTDSYKVSMQAQYPPGTQRVYSYIESRGGEYDQVVMFGLQKFLIDYMQRPIDRADIEYAEEILALHGVPFNKESWEYILEEHNGYLPVTIRAVPEGTVVPYKNVLLTIENNDPKCFWLTTWLETALLRAIWYPSTVASQSRKIKQLIMGYLEETGDPSGIDFKLHDFGARGVSSFESAGIGGAAHLINFKGSDTLTGVLIAKEYYNCPIAGFSIPAAEHSTITSWGKDNESNAYRNMLHQFAKPGSIVAIVSDSYDIYNAVESIWGEELRQEVIDSGAVVVIRPDSGDPVEVNSRLIEILGEKFGFQVNEKGFKVLNHVRLIQGDGVCYESIKNILEAFKSKGWSADNIAFGMGGALLQQVNRDTNKFAMKCSAIQINDQWVDVFKDPITDSGKTSKKGRVTLWESDGQYVSSVEKPTSWTDKNTEWRDALQTVYDGNGYLLNLTNFDDVRERAKV